MLIYIIEEDGELPTSLASNGIATNRNAIGPLTVTVPVSVLGDRYEIHSVESVETLTVAFNPPQHFLFGTNAVSAVRLEGGGSLIVTKTTPSTWTGQVCGQYTLTVA